MKSIEEFNYECEQRFDWWVKGIGIHGISPKLFASMKTESIVRAYNVEMSFFKLKKS